MEKEKRRRHRDNESQIVKRRKEDTEVKKIRWRNERKKN
jgi:hypothetical protein